MPQWCPAGTTYPLPVTVTNASSITIGSVYLLDTGGTNKVAINASGQLAVQAPPSVPYPTGTAADPCLSPSVVKTTVPIAVTSATTTQLVAPSGTTATYICGGVFTIAPSATSADTALFESGTGATCTGTYAMTGTFGNGDLTTAAAPIVVPLVGELVTPASQGVCVVTAGTAVSVQGYVTEVQQ
jgi:hypothetical protein